MKNKVQRIYSVRFYTVFEGISEGSFYHSHIRPKPLWKIKSTYPNRVSACGIKISLKIIL